MIASPIGTATPNTVYAQQSTSPIGAATPNTVYTQHGAKPACQEATHTKCSHLLLTQHLLLVQLPRTQFTHNTSTSPIDAATPNTVYTRQPACQEAINAKFSHLLLAQLFRTQFTHSRAPNPHARKPSTQNVRISKYCACHANRSRGPRRPGAPEPFLEAPSTAPATQTGAAAHGDQARRNLEAPSTAPATQTGAAAHGDQARQNPFWRLQVLRLPRRQEPRPTATRRAATLSGGSKYCACHANRSRGPRRPGAPEPFLEAPSTAPATQTGAAAHGDQARRNPF